MQHTLKTVIEQERRQTKRLTAAKVYFEQMKYDLQEVVQHFHAKDELRTLFRSFHNKYMRNEKVEDMQLDEDVKEEHKRQKVTLEKQLTELRRQPMRDDQFQTKEQGRLFLQNAALIDKLQGLRVQNRHLISTASISKKQTKAFSRRQRRRGGSRRTGG
jgi:predicted ribosome quality control (RQC) complex YloA/Tae2 family protein